MTKIVFQILPFFLFLLACNNDPKPKAGENTSAATAQDANKPPVTYLEGIYATSTAAGKGVENLFDANPNSEWQTLPGAGPDEGIMLYFQQPMAIASIEVVSPNGSIALSTVVGGNPIVVYTNGQIANEGLPNKAIAVGNNGPVKSLFIRFLSTGKEAAQDIQENVQRFSYPADASIAVAELKIMNGNGEILHFAPPRAAKGRVTASSTLAPASAYTPANLFDSRKEFVWADGAATSGEGEVLSFEFDEAVNITAIQIWNGYQRSDEHFSANARLRDFEFGAKGAAAQPYAMSDIQSGQKFQLSAPIKGNAFELKVKSVFPGKNYKDLAISDMVFYDGDQPFVLRSNLNEVYQSELRAKAASSAWAPMLDKRLSNSIVEEDVVETTQSLILRSDGTFVLYSATKLEGTPDGSSFADGNWTFLPNGKIKIFGKWTDLLNLPKYYAGTEQQNPTRIFNDILSIDAKTVSGQKMVSTFFLK